MHIPRNILKTLLSNLRCMKKFITNIDLTRAITRATVNARLPRLIPATATVMAVSESSPIHTSMLIP